MSKIILEIKLMLQHLNKYNFLNCFENYTFEYFFSANLETLTYLYFMYFVEYFKEIISTQVIRVCQNITTWIMWKVKSPPFVILDHFVIIYMNCL